jgi:hypothetical protein
MLTFFMLILGGIVLAGVVSFALAYFFPEPPPPRPRDDDEWS